MSIKSSEQYTRLLDDVIQYFPDFISIREEMISDGEVNEMQLISPPRMLDRLPHAICETSRHLIQKLLNSKPQSNSSSKTRDFLENVKALIDFEDFQGSVARIMKFLSDESKSEMLIDNILDTIPKNDIVLSNVEIKEISLFLFYSHPLRILRNHCVHVDGPNYVLSRKKKSTILSLLNDEIFSSDMEKVSRGAITLLSIFLDKEISRSSLDKNLKKFEEQKNRISNNSLEAYKMRLDNLVWGPKQYRRDVSTIKKSLDALGDNKVVSLYGIGGVGKTALAQFMMRTIIHNREPYTHIVTFSSKVGSDQKEINTIDLERGRLIETDETNSVMESSLFRLSDDEIKIGGLRAFLSRVYREVKGIDPPPIETGDLEKIVLNLLSDKDIQVFMVVDNFEDIEDNIEENEVGNIRNEFIAFFKKFSEIETKSRIIVTTRSSPVDISYGIQVKPLNKNEASTLFKEKLAFRARRASAYDKVLSDTLSTAHRNLSEGSESFHKMVESFNVWETNDKQIAHPLLVLSAAEEVTSSNLNDISKIIETWGEDSKKVMDVLDYCVTKTFGSFSKSEVALIKLLANHSHRSTNVNTEFMVNLLTDVREGKLHVIDDIERRLLMQVTDDKCKDILFKMTDRSFLLQLPKKIMWNHLVYRHMISMFGIEREEIKHDTNVVKTESSLHSEVKQSTQKVSQWINHNISNPDRSIYFHLLMKFVKFYHKIFKQLVVENMKKKMS